MDSDYFPLTNGHEGTMVVGELKSHILAGTKETKIVLLSTALMRFKTLMMKETSQII